MNTVSLAEVPRSARIPRTPKHTHYIDARPFQIAPFMIAPVLPGESLKDVKFQARVVSDKIKNSLIGAHLEFYWFFVSVTDLAARDDFREMFVDPQKDVSAYKQTTAADTDFYTYVGGMKWPKLAYIDVVEKWFREEGEAWDDHLIGNYAAAAFRKSTFLQSAILESNLQAAGVDPNVDLDSDTNITASEVEKAMRMWQLASMGQLTEMTFEDYCRSFGVAIPKKDELHVPELLYSLVEWTLPTNTVDPATGTPTAAWTWLPAMRRKDTKFFKQPGFIVGLSVVRPKVYFSGQIGAGVGMLDDAYSWLPAVLAEDTRTSLKSFDGSDGPVPSVTNPYYVDVRDLFIHGDQWVQGVAGSGEGLVAFPTSALAYEYPDATAADAFMNTTGGVITQDGVTDLTILGTQVDHTP